MGPPYPEAVSRTFGWLKGHGTENDFIVLPDPDGSVHGRLDPALVAALCHRRRGIGADGVLRVVRSEAAAEYYAEYDGAVPSAAESAWFMDYRNADGSLSQMCGNGVRVFARYLAEAGLVDPTGPLPIGTRGGVVVAHFLDGDVRDRRDARDSRDHRDDRGARDPRDIRDGRDDRISVDMGPARLLGQVRISAGDRTWTATKVSTGNPHAVVLVDDLAEAGPLLDPPGYDPADFPEGVNVEFVRKVVPGHIEMRVFERGSGETRSCGTGACAAAVAHISDRGIPRPVRLRVDVPGGRLDVSWDEEGGVVLTGPAVLGPRGDLDPTWLGR
jgi:diaminopimelate epimerase